MLLLPLSCLLVALNARAEPVHVPIVRRSLEGRIDWADAAENLRGKYHYPSFNYSSTVKRRLERRQSSAGFQMIDQVRPNTVLGSDNPFIPPRTETQATLRPSTLETRTSACYNPNASAKRLTAAKTDRKH